jgi:hypothetical protein
MTDRSPSRSRAAVAAIKPTTENTTMAVKKMTFAAAMKDYFGFREGHATVGGFMAELRALTDEDKAELRKLLPTVGYEIVNA